ncbi:ComEA family DNA-binding protein [Gordonia sp. HNM0687]|uniref:ComEA family DNA-binding protein n=1 Tax=Gordonia mangrovi TaxID=2665643 RepID=A0A6L7GMY1_9ACTN|nr:ComEA family DNA-binding protein [Gordonia mangrovi]MXP20962.1 ComEA family DNA-binding protein [Gordonia mangrovi]UVF78489.1 ComEA family DNA-binding protein [Gordonia mangrovi]
MSTTSSRRRSGLDRLDTRAPTTATAQSEDNTLHGDSIAEEHDSGGVGGPWGVTAVPTWFTPVDDAERAGQQMSVGERFGDVDADESDDEPRRRFLVAPPAAIALILVGIAACAVAGFSLLRGGTDTPTTVAFPATAGPSAAGGVTTSDAPATASAAEVVVSVVGLVHRPGLVRLAAEARVADAIARAGGARKGADLLSLNLAQRLNDGDQVLVGYGGDGGRMALRSAVVGAGGQASAAQSGASGDPGSSSGKVDLNSATEAQLDELPGVGPVTAQAIISWRDTHGRFTSVDQLAEVDGIGPARFARLRDLVTV